MRLDIALTFMPVATTTEALVAHQAAPVVELGYVSYEGIYNATSGWVCSPSTQYPYLTLHSINSFFGIKYAAAPVGQLRWRPPVNIESSNNYSSMQMPLDASSNGPFCVQGNPAWQGKPPGGTGQNEDCLILDVEVPAKPTSKFLPVVV